jgi:hypothetical protein
MTGSTELLAPDLRSRCNHWLMIPVRDMHLDLTDEEAAALLKELDGLIDGDRYFLSLRSKMLRARACS